MTLQGLCQEWFHWSSKSFCCYKQAVEEFVNVSAFSSCVLTNTGKLCLWILCPINLALHLTQLFWHEFHYWLKLSTNATKLIYLQILFHTNNSVLCWVAQESAQLFRFNLLSFSSNNSLSYQYVLFQYFWLIFLAFLNTF